MGQLWTAQEHTGGRRPRPSAVNLGGGLSVVGESKGDAMNDRVKSRRPIVITVVAVIVVFALVVLLIALFGGGGGTGAGDGGTGGFSY
jgi:hypothetical protein